MHDLLFEDMVSILLGLITRDPCQLVDPQNESGVVLSPRPPPQSKRRAVQIYQSPNREKLSNALLEGGSSNSQLCEQARTLSEQIEFFRITERPLQELMLSGKYQGFTYSLQDAAQGSLILESGKFLGIGTFKTASLGYLTLIHLGANGLGTTPSECVAAKRMYVRRAKPTESNPNGWIMNRLMPTMMSHPELSFLGNFRDFPYSTFN
ncbi:hypothetical protein B0H13DRAFT_2363300 [Mycena leptocephala]|nr:hypothetical protein B0H13DRAFT_2363300 [Mycena leptocephala]